VSAPRGGRLILYGLVVLVGAGIAVSGRPFWVQLALGVTISAIVALSWDVLGRTGQVSLGQAAFFGIGAYASALLTPPLGVLLAWIGALVVCAMTAVVLGLITLRLRRMYFSIATLGFTLCLQVMVLMFEDWTGGAGGISPVPLAGGNHEHQLLVITGFLLAATVASDVFLTGRFRPAFFMVRANPELAAASGVPVVLSKVLAFTVSGVLAGLAGAAYGALYGYVVPGDVFTLHWSVTPVAITILGGSDSTLGPLVGAVALRALEELARAWVGGVGYQVVYGAVIIVFIVVLPAGLVGYLPALARRIGGT
jgi:branched-chain amino acid transport system permease protein